MYDKHNEYKSTVHPIYDILLIGFPISLAVCLVVFFIDENVLAFDSQEKIISFFLMILFVAGVAILMLDFRFNTRYIFRKDVLVLKSSFYSTTINIHDISQVSFPIKIINAGVRPLLDLTGMLIIYGEGYQIQLAPERSDEFVKKLIDINPKIKVFKKS